MSKTPSSKLYKLIKSLSGSEKRYFKIYSNTGNEARASKYIQLFDAIDLQETYDEENLKATIYAGETIQSRKFSELKSYLYELLLKSLQSYDEKESVHHKMKGFLHSVRVLYKRSHYNECKKLLQKSWDIAAEQEHFVTMLEILRWEKKIAYAQIDVAFLNSEMGRIIATEKKILNKLENKYELKNTYLQMHALLRQNPGEQQHEILNELLPDKSAVPEFYEGLLFFYKIYALHYAAGSNWVACYEALKDLLSMMASRPKLTSEYPRNYLSALNDFSEVCRKLKKGDELEMSLEKIRTTSSRSLDDQLKIHHYYYQHKLQYCIETGAFEEGLKLLNAHFKAAKKFEEDAFPGSDYDFICFYIFFGVNQFKPALDYLDRWRKQPQNLARPEVRAVAGMLFLIVQYEIGELDFSATTFQDYRYILRKQQNNFESVKTLLDFFKKNDKTSATKTAKSAFISLQKTMKTMSGKASEKVLFETFDFVAWADSKVEALPFSEVVKRNYFSSN